MNYLKAYNNLVDTRKARVLVDGEYYERHHIVLKSMGGSNKKSNLVYFTAREHFIAHWLLWRIYRNKQTAFAFSIMSGRKKENTNKYVPKSIAYNEARKARAIKLSENHIYKGKNLPVETRKKISIAHQGKKLSDEHKESIKAAAINSDNYGMKGKNHKKEAKEKLSKFAKTRVGENAAMYGKKRTQENKNKISETMLENGTAKGENNGMFGKNHTEETRMLQREIALNREKKVCPYCKGSFSPSMAKRWHFENCKKRNG